MLVFIDESGDAGFRLDKGSTPIFAAAMVIFRDREEANRVADVIRGGLIDLNAWPEFKFSKCRDQIRDAFFDLVAPFDFFVRAVVVRKEIIHSPRLRSDRETFYRYFVRSMIEHDDGALQRAKVIIDGSGDRIFRRDLVTAVRRRVRDGSVKDVKVKDSRRDPLVQLADMCVGALARSYRSDRKNPCRWRNRLGGKLRDVWEFE